MMVPERILLDIETQQDFFTPGGSCYVPEAYRSAAQVRRLFNWARKNHIPVVSTVLRVRKGQKSPLASVLHCIEDTTGEQKISGTILPKRINLGLRNTTDLPRRIFEKYQQIIFEKRDTDIFAHARAERLISELGETTFFVCGAGIAHGIVEATIGLRNRGFTVIVAEDAILDLNDPMAEMAYLRMQAKRIIFTPTKEIISIRLPRKPMRLAKPAHAK